MTWIALYDAGHDRPWAEPETEQGRGDDALLSRGSLVIETRLPTSARPRTLVRYRREGAWPLMLSLQAIPGGGLTLVLDQGGEVVHCTVNHSDVGRTDALRITYSWDAPGRWGRLALERTDYDKVIVLPVSAPRPLQVADLLALTCPGPANFIAPEVAFLAVSTAIEPVGPMPSLAADTPIATPAGYRAVSDIRRGDTVLSASGETVPVLQSIRRTVPASGSLRPTGLRAPYFGLLQDVVLAPSQRLVLSGSEVEYLFGCEAVLAAARHLSGGPAAVPARASRFVTYWQLLLPGHDALVAAGSVVESFYIGRLRREKHVLQATLLGEFDRRTLPDHGRPVYPALRAFDAVILAEQRAA